MLQYCSHCDRRVLPNLDGTCPGCRKSNALGAAELASVRVEKNQKRIVLRGHQKFPNFCAFCGSVATESRVLTWARKSPHAQGDQVPMMWSFLFGALGKLIGMIFDKGEQVVSFRLPHCRDCAHRNLEISELDWDDYRVTAWCHEKFAEEVARHQPHHG